MAISSIFGWLMKKRIHQIDLFKIYPIEVQREWMERLILKGRGTDFGRKYNFDDIENYDDFKEKVPLHDYNLIKPWVDRAVNGEEDVLWPGETKWFAKSSGTTDTKSKFIPVTKESLEDCHYNGGKDLLALYYIHNPNSKLYKGKHLVVGGSAAYSQLKNDSYSGDLSAIILKNLPWWAEIKRTPSQEIALMDKWEEKIEQLAQSTAYEDVSSVSGVPSWTLVLFNRILEITGKANMHEVWPNLELYMHGGVSFTPYIEEFKRLIPSDKMNYIESYNASEGFFGIQDEIDGDLLLMLDYGIFFEFIPMEDFNGTQSENIISLQDVELETNYALVISTNGGLWRYIVGDTVKFSSLRPYRLKVSGRTKHFINVFGEEMIIENADAAIAYACEKTKARIRDYTACPIFMNEGKSGGHEWLIEFIKEPEDTNVFMQYLDEKIMVLNSDYEAKRTNNLTLDFPKFNKAEPGLFDAWLKKNGKLGGQHKIPRLSNSRIIFEDIIKSKGMIFDK